jgi:hypothetical protein
MFEVIKVANTLAYYDERQRNAVKRFIVSASLVYVVNLGGCTFSHSDGNLKALVPNRVLSPARWHYQS